MYRQEVSSAVMTLTVMFSKAHCEISMLSTSLSLFAEKFNFSVYHWNDKLTRTFNFMS